MVSPEVIAELERAIQRVILDACELPDRTSPDDQPEMLLITGEELDMLLRRHLGLEDSDGILLSLHQARAEVERVREVLKAAKALCDNINEFGACTDAEIYDAADTAIRSLFSPTGGRDG